MIFYYAAGGGLGHLTRARAVLHTLGMTAPVTLLSASPFADDRRIVGDLPVIKIPQSFAASRQEYRGWLERLFAEHRPTELFLDAFPAGLLGEFCDFPFPAGLKLHYVARLLRWQEYSRQLTGKLPTFAVTYQLEPLTPIHEQFIERHSQAVIALSLSDPPHPLTDDIKEQAVRLLRPTVIEYTLSNRQQAMHKPVWLIVHAGADTEVAALLAYAEEMSRLEAITPRLLILSPQNPNFELRTPNSEPQTPNPEPQTPNPELQDSAANLVTRHSSLVTEHANFYPASALFPIAARIITACGFNAMRQTEVYKEKHRFLPFPRRFDDQFQRASYRRRLPEAAK